MNSLVHDGCSRFSRAGLSAGAHIAKHEYAQEPDHLVEVCVRPRIAPIARAKEVVYAKPGTLRSQSELPRFSPP
eukprot:7563476-Alexandrium_andersonii.AAC.1